MGKAISSAFKEVKRQSKQLRDITGISKIGEEGQRGVDKLTGKEERDAAKDAAKEAARISAIPGAKSTAGITDSTSLLKRKGRRRTRIVRRSLLGGRPRLG